MRRDEALADLARDSASSIRSARDRGSLPSGDGKAYFVSRYQADIVDQAIDLVRLSEDAPDLSEARCLELIAVSFMLEFARHRRGEKEREAADGLNPNSESLLPNRERQCPTT